MSSVTIYFYNCCGKELRKHEGAEVNVRRLPILSTFGRAKLAVVRGVVSDELGHFQLCDDCAPVWDMCLKRVQGDVESLMADTRRLVGVKDHE